MRTTIAVPRACHFRRGWDSNPRTPVEMLLEFQSSALDRSATSPINDLPMQPRRIIAASESDLEKRAMILRRRQAKTDRQVAGAGRGGFGVAKLGGSSRQGSVGPRGGGSGSLSAGILSEACVSGVSRPAGTRSGGTEVAFA